MNTYRAVQTEAGYWVVSWWVDGIWQGPVWGAFATGAEAAFCAFELALMEIEEWREFGGT